MAPIGTEGKYTAKMSAMAATALFVALAAVPVLAQTAQEKVIRRLSCETSAAAGGETSQGEEAARPGTLQMRQELEQGSYQDSFIHRISGETSTGAGRENSQGKEATRSGTPAISQMRQALEQGGYQEAYIRRLAGDLSRGRQ